MGPYPGLIRCFLRDQRGATAVEYGMIVAALSIVVITAVTATGKNLYNIMNTLSAKIAGS